MTRNGIPVCVHLGLTPQSVHVFGGYKLQARTREAADQLIADCQAVVDAGAAVLLLECVPAQLGKEIRELFPQVPVIGIGAGVDTDGQVLVVQDMLGLTFGRVAKVVRNFMKEQAGETAILDCLGLPIYRRISMDFRDCPDFFGIPRIFVGFLGFLGFT